MADRELAPATVFALGRAGADKVILCEGPGLGAPPLEATHGAALLSAVERVPPLMVLFPAGGAGADLGPSLAARIGAAFAARADLVVSESGGPLTGGVGRVFLRRWRSDRASYRRLDPVEIERPVVALLSAGQFTDHPGAADIDVEVIACPSVQTSIEEIASEPDDRAHLSLAQVLVVVDAAIAGAALGRLIAAAPPGVVVVERAAAQAQMAAGAPDILIGVGHADLPMVGTPRARVGVILFGDAPLPPRALADFLWRALGDPNDLVWEDLVGALAALGAPVRSRAAVPGSQVPS